MSNDTTDEHPPVDRATGKLVVSYAIVGVPLIYGLVMTATKAAQLFSG